MLTRIAVKVMILRSGMSKFQVKTLYWNKYLPGQSATVRL